MHYINNFTAEEIFTILRINQEVFSKLDKETDSVLVEKNDTIFQWRRMNNLYEWSRLYKIQNKMYNISLDENEWLEIILNEKEKTILDFCDFISRYAKKEDLNKIKNLDEEVFKYEIFLLLMKNIERWGITVKDIKLCSDLSILKKLADFSKLVFEVSKFGVSISDTIELKHKKNLSFLEKINFFNTKRFYIETGKIKTFEDLIIRILEKGFFGKKKG